MPPKDLSSNWKKLQKKLSDDSAGSKQSKGKKGTDELQLRKASLKRKPARAIPASESSPKRRKSNRTKMSAIGSSSTPSYLPSQAKGGSANAASNDNSTPQTRADAKLGKYIALDCEMVGVASPTAFSTPAHNPPINPTSGTRVEEHSILARASLVSYTGGVLYDAYVLPTPHTHITNYRTAHSGITPDLLTKVSGAKELSVVQAEVAALLGGRILVGHALRNDLAVLGLAHPMKDTRDTSRYPKFRARAAVVGKGGKVGRGRTPALRKLAAEVLGWEIQGGNNRSLEQQSPDDDTDLLQPTAKRRIGHDSVEDARAAMALFRHEKDGFEGEIARKYGRRSNGGGRKAEPQLSKVEHSATRSVHGPALEANGHSSEEFNDESDTDGGSREAGFVVRSSNSSDAAHPDGTALVASKKKPKKKPKRKKNH